MSIEIAGLLHLLFVSDSSLPTGGFTTSSGWEAAAHDGALQTAGDAAGWLHGMLHEQLAAIEAPVMARAYRVPTVRGAHAASSFLDRLIPVPGWRAASKVSGARLLSLCSEPSRDWHRAVACGWLARRHDAPLVPALAAYAHATLWAQAQVGVRLGLWSGDAAATTVTSMAPRIAAVAESAAVGRIRPMCGVSWEIAGMRQPMLATRVFST